MAPRPESERTPSYKSTSEEVIADSSQRGEVRAANETPLSQLRKPRIDIMHVLADHREAAWCMGGIAVVLMSIILNGPVTDVTYGSAQAEILLDHHGYTDTTLVDKSDFLANWQGCAGNDSVKYEFEAIAPDHKTVNVLVCKGLFKAATIHKSTSE